MDKKKCVSQQRIASDLGVTQALVSMALNGKRENIRESTYRRIWDHALKLGYRPKGMQAGGSGIMTRNVGLILRSGLRLHSQTQFWSHVQHGLYTGLLAYDYHSVFLGSEDDLGVRAVKEKLRSHPLFGVAVLGQVDERFLNAVKGVHPNLVAISACYPGICHSVMPNDRQALDLLVRHLTGLGHRQFAWIGGNTGLSHNQNRRAALIEALGHYGLGLADRFEVNVETGDRLGGWKAGEMMLGRISRKSFPTAWVCTNGLMARGVVNCLTQNGWRVPEEISLVAVDATRLCEEEHPKITGAHADPEKIGQTAAELLLKHADSERENLMDVILPSRLAVRGTSAKSVQNLPVLEYSEKGGV